MAKEQAALAEDESAKGFPLLCAHSVVATWGAFEAAIEDTVVNVMLDQPETLDNQAFAKIRVPFAEFQTSDNESRIRFLLAETLKNQGRKQGVESFEVQLGLVGLSGAVDDETKKTIWEMHHVRNVIVHRASCADNRLVEACPWLNLQRGQRIVVTRVMLAGYGSALCRYDLNILYRLVTRYGMDVEQLKLRVMNVTGTLPS